MVISKEFVLERLKTRKENPDDEHFKQIEALKKEHKELKMQVHGVNVGEYIVKIEGLENDTKKKLRKKLSKSNRAFWSDVLGPTNKIFSKQGGSKEYGLKGDNLEAFKKYLSEINKGSSFQQWLKSYFVDKYVIDPNGLFLVEHYNKKPYPTYKSILSIADYEPDGLSVEWVIFEPKKCKDDARKDKEIYEVRVYDDDFDYLYEVDMDNWNINLIQYEEYEDGSREQKTFPNPWKKVPAVLCSDIEDTINDGFKRSPIYPQMEDAMEYLRINSVNTLQYYHHGFAKFWKHGTPCKRCGGQGQISITNGPGGDHVWSKCPSCGGQKTMDKEDVSDVTYVSVPKDGGKSIAPDVMGYITPPIESLKSLDEKCKEMRDNIHHSHWGMIIDRQNKDQTAFEVATNTQPIQDKLNHYTDSLENIESHLVNLFGQFLYPGVYKGSSINYGRNYVIKGSEQLLKDYQEAKEKNSSYTILNEKLIKYYNALYSNDPKSLDVAIKLMKVEPFIHNTLTEVIGWNTVPEMTKQKIFYNSWLSTLKQEDLLLKDVKMLKDSLKEFTSKEEGINQNIT